MEGSACSGNEDANCKKFGRLYDKETAMKICPSGWHLPSEKEWKTLLEFADSDDNLKAKGIWKENGDYASRCLDTVEDFTDDYGFSALPGGYGIRESSSDEDGNNSYSFDFGGGRDGGNWWNSAGSYQEIISYIANASASDFYCSYWPNCEGELDDNKTYLFSVRCVQD